MVDAASHHDFMRMALALADEAARAGEVPVGAVVVVGGVVIGRGFNQPIGARDPTAHAEIVALREAALTVGNYRLTDAILYVTVEPCLMCVGATVHARVKTVVYGTSEPKTGAVESQQRGYEQPGLNHRVTVVAGVLARECSDRLTAFFRQRRLDARAL
jgi:tRNA(Arg) A34 adenosine deaminase TadA